MDISQDWGADLTIGPTGDLAVIAAPGLTQQRVLRRLLTNTADYIWQTTYGAGLPQFVGQPVNALQLQAVIRSQIFQEPAVAPSPEPTVDITGDNGGNVSVQLRYTDATTSQTQVLSFAVGN